MLTFVELMTETEYPEYTNTYTIFFCKSNCSHVESRGPTEMPTPNWLFIRKLNSHKTNVYSMVNERRDKNQFIYIKFIFILPQCERTTF